MTRTVSIASASPQPLARAPSVVSVLTAEDLAATGATDLMDILQAVPGVYVRRNLFGYKPLLSMRGAAGVNVLLMIDGAPIKDLVWSPSIFWKGVPANAIERIEIIRGPGSALYGADAAAGVINVVTRAAAGDEAMENELGGRVANPARADLWLRKTGELGPWHYVLTANATEEGGHDPEIRRDRLGASGRAEYAWHGLDVHFALHGVRWRFLFDHVQRDDVAIGLTGAAVLDPTTRASERQTSLAWLYENPVFAHDWGAHAELRWRDLAYDSGNGFWERLPSVTLNRLAVTERRLAGEGSLVYRGFTDHSLRFGAGAFWQTPESVEQFHDGVPKHFIPETTRRDVYSFVQDVWRLSNEWELTLGLRRDRYSDFGVTTNPRASLVWQATPQWSAKFMIGSAFRAPSYLELYSETAATRPNPDLRPEKSRTAEFSLTWQPSRRFALGGNLYDFRRHDVIAEVDGRFANRAGVYHTRGIELEARWQLRDDLSFAANHSRFSQDGALRDPNIPLAQSYLRLDGALTPKWRWNLQLHRFSARPLPEGDPRQPIGTTTLVDLATRYYHGADWEFAAGVRNLFAADNFDYSSTRLPGNLPGPRRRLWLEARFKF